MLLNLRIKEFFKEIAEIKIAMWSMYLVPSTNTYMAFVLFKMLYAY